MDWDSIPNRPWSVGEEGRRTIALEIVEDLVEAGIVQANRREAAVADIARLGRRRMDGYALAKALDDYAGWDVTSTTVEILDSFPTLHDAEVEKAVREWVRHHGIVPDLQPGDPVVATWGGDVVVGTVDHVSPHYAARYLVKPPEGSDHAAGSLLYVDFEKARRPEDPTPAP